MKDVKLNIETQGEVLINRAFVYRTGSHVAAVYIDCKTKYADLLGTGEENFIPEIYLQATEDSLHINTQCEKELPTSISFPEYKHWEVFSVQICKYTIAVCFTKP